MSRFALPSGRTLLLGVFLLGALALFLERVIVTDGERIEALVERCVSTVKAEDWDAFTGCLHPEFRAEERDREAAVAYARSLWGRYRPVGLSVDLDDIDVDGDRAACDAEIRANVLGRPSVVPVRLEFQREGDAWRLQSFRFTGWARPL